MIEGTPLSFGLERIIVSCNGDVQAVYQFSFGSYLRRASKKQVNGWDVPI